jgi:hypothetical protein
LDVSVKLSGLKIPCGQCIPAHHNLNNQQLKLRKIMGEMKVSVAGCLGYDVLEPTSGAEWKML